MSKLATAIALSSLVAIAAHAVAADPPAAHATPPAGAGLDLINERCGFCHTTGQVFASRKTPAEWNATVQSMAARGAEVTPEEIKVIADYLGQNYATPASAPAPH